MIDFKNAEYLKLKPVNNSEYADRITPMLIADEEILASFRAIRDGVVFTNNRIFVINIQGITGKKVDYTSLPYSKVQAFSVETAGTFDLDNELDLFFSGDIGQVRFELKGNCNILEISRIIASYVL